MDYSVMVSSPNSESWNWRSILAQVSGDPHEILPAKVSNFRSCLPKLCNAYPPNHLSRENASNASLNKNSCACPQYDSYDYRHALKPPYFPVR